MLAVPPVMKLSLNFDQSLATRVNSESTEIRHDPAASEAFRDRVLLLPCFHDEPFARLPALRATFAEVGGILYHSAEERSFAEAGRPEPRRRSPTSKVMLEAWFWKSTDPEPVMWSVRPWPAIEVSNATFADFALVVLAAEAAGSNEAAPPPPPPQPATASVARTTRRQRRTSTCAPAAATS